MYLAYQVMILLLYFFSFTVEQGIYCSGYSRFNFTALIILYGSMLIIYMGVYDKGEQHKQRDIFFSIFLVVIMLISGIRFDLFGHKRGEKNNAGLCREELVYIGECVEMPFDLHKRIGIYVKQTENKKLYFDIDYLEKFAQYIFWSDEITIITKENLQRDSFENLDYLILYDCDIDQNTDITNSDYKGGIIVKCLRNEEGEIIDVEQMDKVTGKL